MTARILQEHPDELAHVGPKPWSRAADPPGQQREAGHTDDVRNDAAQEVAEAWPTFRLDPPPLWGGPGRQGQPNPLSARGKRDDRDNTTRTPEPQSCRQ